ncbi:hypothetical protein CCR94_09595 [Rhodoblastus sphagnicola]|uniref:Gamma-glutamylcyclotransferase n=1 Tax=Rhodoblastus sphagnicola TaxID=333368 RepID=A0A2S6N9K3_9HYPH|nr:gamma-glutamylcyclotransferase [Rhodoblastus sphagnicola]MBB4200418.1 hypothetical protein [Rhodoblastus sphagnicola]PPQ31295.1 hypothetical protein CCR94_09595 [Rhodoblastus sphagnicola]
MPEINDVGADLSSRESVLFFAYGGAMDPAQISGRCGLMPEKIAPARLADYALGFFGRDERWDGGEETILRQVGAHVWGVVWKVPARAFDRLDAWQGVRLDGTGAYFHSPVNVTTADGETIAALAYRKTELGFTNPPSAPNLARIASAARAHGLPDAYVAALDARPSVAAEGPVPRAARADRFLANAADLGYSCAC